MKKLWNCSGFVFHVPQGAQAWRDVLLSRARQVSTETIMRLNLFSRMKKRSDSFCSSLLTLLGVSLCVKNSGRHARLRCAGEYFSAHIHDFGDCGSGPYPKMLIANRWSTSHACAGFKRRFLQFGRSSQTGRCSWLDTCHRLGIF